MALIDIQHITKDYGDGRGIFDLIFLSKKAKCLVLSELMGQGRRQRFVI